MGFPNGSCNLLYILHCGHCYINSIIFCVALDWIEDFFFLMGDLQGGAPGAMYSWLWLLSFPPHWHVLWEEASCHPVVSHCGAISLERSRQSSPWEAKSLQRSAKDDTCWILILFLSEVKRLCIAMFAIYIGKGQKGFKILRQLISQRGYVLAKKNRCDFWWTMYRINLGVLLKHFDGHRAGVHVSTLHG